MYIAVVRVECTSLLRMARIYIAKPAQIRSIITVTITATLTVKVPSTLAIALPLATAKYANVARKAKRADPVAQMEPNCGIKVTNNGKTNIYIDFKQMRKMFNVNFYTITRLQQFALFATICTI